MSNSNKLETWGNETNMNMNPIIYQNILASPYFKSLYDKKTYHEIVDEIYNEVYTLGKDPEHVCPNLHTSIATREPLLLTTTPSFCIVFCLLVGPFMKGTAASTAFCLLFKLWTQRLTVKQVEGLIDHTDSPYVCTPKELWDWLGPYIDDDEEITIVGGPKPVNRDNKGGRNGSTRKDSYADRESSRSKEDYRRRDDSRGSKNDRDRRRSRSRSRSRSPHRRQRSRHDSRDRRDSRDRHDSRDRRRERPVSPRDEFDDYERRSRRDDEHNRYSRDRYSDRSRDRSRSRSRDRSSRRRSRSRDYDRKRY
ncbi:hypothetical protein NQZ79_g5140 [Umbelopsis isabellina]|nr:hypothetical protein NQZ79_g5140 [Umbelopsis isabellina]